MPWSVRWEHYGVYVKFSGACSSNELLEAVAAVVGDPRLDSLRYSIFDYLDVDVHDATEVDAEEAAAQFIGISFTNPRIFFASVAIDERIRELWHHFLTQITVPERQGLFRSLLEAKDWLVSQQSGLSP